MLKAGDIVSVDFPGAAEIKRRPAVVISTDTYHSHRPDIIVSIITSQTADAITPLDYILRDWAAAGLHRASAFRMFLATLPVTAARIIGHCSERDWQAIQDCLTRGIAFS